MKIKFRLTMRRKLYFLSFLFICLPLLIFAIINYKLLDKNIELQTETRLKEQAIQLKMTIESSYNEIKSIKKGIDNQAKKIVKAEAKAVIKFMNLFPGTDEELKNIIASIDVGKTGYIWVTDYSGKYIVSFKRARDGESIWNAKDTNGVLFIQEAIKKTKSLTNSTVDFQIYPWQNKNELKPRDKIACLVHDVKRKWVVGVSVYFDELVNENKTLNKLEKLKMDISKIVVGKTGYVYVLDSKGNYIVSFKRKRDGENIINAKDANGRLFIKEICKIGKELKSDECGVTYYPWKNKGETS